MFHRSELLQIEATLSKSNLAHREEVDTFLECAYSAAVKSGLELEAVNNKKGVRLLSLDLSILPYYLSCSTDLGM